MNTRLVNEQEYWILRAPYDSYLPDTVLPKDVEVELGVMEARFRKEAQCLGEEGVTWSFVDHYQHVRVFYVYVFSPNAVCPSLANAIEQAMVGFEDRWIGEIECYENPGGLGDLRIIIYLKGEFIFEEDELSKRFALALHG